mmetsp:Transcript_52745/g.107596  ORF Transcript_52745/g.107596 Transcript_52745/m.107596 type:complete len:92 (-) Transcript_52745:43-318(-)
MGSFSFEGSFCRKVFFSFKPSLFSFFFSKYAGLRARFDGLCWDGQSCYNDGVGIFSGRLKALQSHADGAIIWGDSDGLRKTRSQLVQILLM